MVNEKRLGSNTNFQAVSCLYINRIYENSFEGTKVISLTHTEQAGVLDKTNRIPSWHEAPACRYSIGLGLVQSFRTIPLDCRTYKESIL